MKRTLVIVLAALLAVSAVVAAYVAGRADGVRAAVEESAIYTVEVYDPQNPEGTARDDGTDQTIYIVIDGYTYERGMYQG